jgi:VWFA-related protein
MISLLGRMRRSPALTILLLWISCGYAFPQEAPVIRIGVPVLSASPNTISVPEARDQLVKVLNQHKPDKKLHVEITAVPLETVLNSAALAEAREKNCQFVISMRLTDLRTSSRLSNDGAQGLNAEPDYFATMEYQIIRVADGAGFGTGLVQKEDPDSLRAAVESAITQGAREAVAHLGGNAVTDGQRATSGSKPGGTTFFAARSCSWIPDNIPHAEAVRGVCEYALNLPQTMPNFICDQDTSRYRGKNKVPFDLLTALVRYENGRESYEEIKLNGKPAPQAITESPGLWSTGQFGSNLRSIFDPGNLAIFEFAKESKASDRAVWVFTYRIARQNDPLWRLHGGNEILAPPYGGELWVEQKTGALVRFTSVAEGIPSAFPMSAASLEIDYDNVAFADGESFVLPSDFTVSTAFRHEAATRNVVQFRNCHKFRATTQIVLNLPGENTTPIAPEGVPAANLQTGESDEGERIYAILREQAVRDDQAQLDLEHTQELNAATSDAIWKLKTMEQQRQKFLAEAAALKPAEPQPAGKPVERIDTIIKVSVKLVPVTVVLRDSKGNAVGNLRKEDFELFDNGKPQPIASFSVETPATEAGEPAQKALRGSPASLVSTQRSVPDRYVAYVFDDIHIAFEDLAAARAAASKHLSELSTEDRAAVYTTSGQVILDFTADRDKLQRALNALRPHPILRGVRCPPMSSYEADQIVNQDDREALGLATADAINCAFAGMKDENTESRAEQIARATAMQVVGATSAENQSFLSALHDIFRRTAAAKGSRSVVLVSPGFLMTTPETRQAITEMIDDALRSEIVVNTLDVRGLSTPVAAPNTSHPANSIVQFKYDREEDQERSEIIADLAYSTGGTFFHNNNDLNEGFRRTADRPEYIYVLGFSPQKLDGRLHKLKVKLKTAAKLDVQSREGYYALKSASK